MPITIVPPPYGPGGGNVTGGGDLNNADRVVIVAGTSEVGESDVTLTSGIFSRAGTVGLSATGANVVTFSTNGSERGRYSSAGNFLLGTNTDNGVNILQVNGTALFTGTNPTAKFLGNVPVISLMTTQTGDQEWKVGIYNNASMFSVYNATASTSPLNIIAANGNVLIGTTTDDGSSKLQVAGNVKVSSASNTEINVASSGLFSSVISFIRNNAYTGYFGSIDSQGIGLFNSSVAPLIVAAPTTGNILVSTSTDGNFKLDVASSGSTGTMRVYDQTATTGVTSLVVRAGAGQGSAYLLDMKDNSNASKLFFQINSGQSVLYSYYDASNYAAWTTASGVSQIGTISNIPFKLIANDTERISLNGTGIGFFGVTPVARQTATADAASILALLQAYGLSN